MTLFDPSEEVPERIEPLEPLQPTSSHTKTTDPKQLVRVGFGLSYDGGGFHGFAPQPGQRTVAGTLCDAIGSLVGHDVTCVCAGRTDVGVHATGQVVHVDLDASLVAQRFKAALHVGEELTALRRAVSAKIGPEVALWHTAIVPGDFDARHSALSRRYRYRIDTDERYEPLRRNLAWYVDRQLDLSLLRLGTDALLGEHDFTAFCRRPKDKPNASLTRRVMDARWLADESGRYVFEIEANAFCHQMVRSIVGTLVAVGIEKIRPSDVGTALRRTDRSEMTSPAPAHGLCLTKVRYPERFGAPWSS